MDVAQVREEERVWLAVLERSHEMQAKAGEALARLAAGR